LGLLVNGMVVIGGLARPSDFAETVDAEWQKAMNLSERPDGTSEEEWASLIEHVSTQGAKIIADEVEHEPPAVVAVLSAPPATRKQRRFVKLGRPC
jgi:sarcosine oxidase delta subunit